MNIVAVSSKSPNWQQEIEQKYWIIKRPDHHCDDDLVLTIAALLCCVQVSLKVAYVKLGEVDATLDDMVGIVQQAESDLASYRQTYGDPAHIRLYLGKTESLMTELSNQKSVLTVLNETVQSVIQHSVSGDDHTPSNTSKFDKKLLEVREMLADVEISAIETRSLLISHLHEVRVF